MNGPAPRARRAHWYRRTGSANRRRPDFRDNRNEDEGTPPRTSRQQFFRDQTDAAQEQADASAAASMVAGGNDVVIAGPTGPYEGLVVDRLTWTLRDDPDARFCTHLSGASVLWWALAPGTPVSCAPCFTWWQQNRIAGTAENTTCDICRQPQQPDNLTARMLNVRFDGDGTVPGVVVIVQYGVCVGCLAKDGQADPGATPSAQP